MRAYENQFSDSRPIRRSTADKQRQLQQLRQQYASLPDRAQDMTRNAIRTKIAELERELVGEGKR